MIAARPAVLALPSRIAASFVRLLTSAAGVRKRASRSEQRDPLDHPLLWLSPVDVFDVRTAVQGVVVLGDTGSGKSSAVGATIGRAYLKAGWGGVVFTVKSGEREFWKRLCQQCDRSDDLLMFSDENPALRFDFLSYEIFRAGRGAGLTENIVGLLCGLSDITERGSAGHGGGGGENSEFWRPAKESIIRNSVDICMIATGSVNVPLLQQVVLSAPTSVEQIRSEVWQANSTCFQLIKEAARRALTERDKRSVEAATDYFGTEFPQLNERTRSIIVTSFNSLVDLLGRGLLHELFSSGTTITPEAAQEGKVIVIDLPLKSYWLTGLIAQTIWRQAFQRSIERRDMTGSPRPTFMWIDEAPHFLGRGSGMGSDMLFQTTARESLCATVMLGQSIGAFRAAFGDGDKGRAEMSALLGNLTLKFICASGDPETQEWASQLGGKRRELFLNASNSRRDGDPFGVLSGFADAGQYSAGVAEHMEPDLKPDLFPRLRTGGAKNQRCVDAIAIRNGGVFNQTCKVWMPVTFSQRP